MPTAKSSRLVTLVCHPATLCIASFFICLILALILFLPLDPFARQLEQLANDQKVHLSIGQPELFFPLGVGAKRLSIDLTPIPHPPIELKNIELQPLLLSLFGKNQGVSFSLNAYQGEISGTAYRDGNLQTTFAGLHLDESLAPRLPLTLTGVLTSGEFEGQLPFAGKNQSQLQLELNNLTVKGMKNLGSEGDLLPIGQLTCRAEAKGPIVQIVSLASNSPAFEIKGSGSLRLGRVPANTSLNLKLVFTPKPGLDPALKDLLKLMKKPQPDGSYQLSLRGALTNLRIN
ncbi:type II secretion system protein GspN [Geopsychrobacter electrodiphilus]|uniref:type II secretion system protein GspN n=1 Tax=Geopsychrobacter electrodiphilus TaxID=225196 RepID=UPI00037464A8|nr:type II secretion system protein GspN [Geopsychrobacter electrodiphilus]